MPNLQPKVLLRIRPSKDIPTRQRKAWGEFLVMLLERAEAEIEQERKSPKNEE